MKKALITGITGQDGAYLSKHLLEKDYEVYGAFRRAANLNLAHLQFLGVDDSPRIKFVPVELLEPENVRRTIERVQPDEIYNLAAQSFVALSFEEPIYTVEVTGLGALRILEAVRAVNPKIKFYQASSSEMFGRARTVPQNERTPFYPRSPYGAAKALAHWITVNYRESYGLFALAGILFNHESPLRGLEFVTRKITHGVARIRFGLQSRLVLGNLDARRDWGYAAEYVEAMWLMLQQPEPADYVIATRTNHSVRDFVRTAFRRTGVNIKFEGTGVDEKGIDEKTGTVLVEVSPDLFRPAEVDTLIGDYAKAKRDLGWEPRMAFDELVNIMVDADVERVAGEMARRGKSPEWMSQGYVAGAESF